MERVSIYSVPVLTSAVILAISAPASAVDFFISSQTSPGSVVQHETAMIDISGGGSGSLGIWAIPDASETLLGVDLNLRVQEDSGNTIDFTAATVLNPPIGGGPTKRWFDDGSITGVGVDQIAANQITGMIGVTTTGTGTSGEGTGLDASNHSSDPAYDSGSGAYLFATVDYTVINSSVTASLFLQIGDGGVSDANGLVSSLIFGAADDPLDASSLDDRNVDSTIADATMSAGGELIGDYNSDSFVDAADYTVWRDNLGGSSLAHRDPANSGPIDEDDYTSWKSHFGESGGGGSLSSAVVPEPASCILVLLAAGCLAIRSRWAD